MSTENVVTGVGDVSEAAALIDDSEKPVKVIKSFDSATTLEWEPIEAKTFFTERVGHALVACKKRQTLYMLGGGNHQGDINEVWEIPYNKQVGEEGLIWQSHPAEKEFGGRYEFAAALSADEDKIWMFGGADFKQPRNDVCYLDLENKEFVTKFALNREIATQIREGTENEDFGVPHPRTQGVNSCLLDIEDQTYMAVYGGGVKGEHAVSDGHLYLFNTEKGEWRRILVSSDTPGIRQGHAMTSVGTKIFVHGGMHEFTIFDDLYSIDLEKFEAETPSWVPLKTELSPCKRAAHGLAKDGQNFYIFGGLGEEGPLGDLWLFNTESLQWSELKTSKFPTPRLDLAITLITIEDGNDSKKVLVVHGGMNTEGTLYNDFLVLALPPTPTSD